MKNIKNFAPSYIIQIKICCEYDLEKNETKFRVERNDELTKKNL
jgi:hypothetical protein